LKSTGNSMPEEVLKCSRRSVLAALVFVAIELCGYCGPAPANRPKASTRNMSAAILIRDKFRVPTSVGLLLIEKEPN
jgi:hypothetical protein